MHGVGGSAAVKGEEIPRMQAQVSLSETQRANKPRKGNCNDRSEMVKGICTPVVDCSEDAIDESGSGRVVG